MTVCAPQSAAKASNGALNRDAAPLDRAANDFPIMGVSRAEKARFPRQTPEIYPRVVVMAAFFFQKYTEIYNVTFSATQNHQKPQRRPTLT